MIIVEEHENVAESKKSAARPAPEFVAPVGVVEIFIIVIEEMFAT